MNSVQSKNVLNKAAKEKRITTTGTADSASASGNVQFYSMNDDTTGASRYLTP